MNQNDRLSQWRWACLFTTRLCLIVSLWQAPIPWWHCHGTNLAQLTSIASALELSAHLSAFHPAIDSNSDQDLGWHFHWILPCWSHPLDESRGEEPPHEFVTFDPAIASSALSTPEGDLLVYEAWFSSPIGTMERDHCAPSPQKFTQETISRQETFAVLRC
jgi:hypothetical protein